MFSTLVLVIVGRDLQVVRNAVRIVLAVNVFKFALYSLLRYALDRPAFPNPFGTPSEVFSVSLRVAAVGGALIIAELLLLLTMFERLKRRVETPALLNALYVACFVGVLCLDGVLFPLLALPYDGLADAVTSGVQAKLILALAYSAPLLVFLVAFRSSIAAYVATPLRIPELFFAPTERLLGEIERQRQALAAQDRALEETSVRHDLRTAVARSVAALDARAPVEDNLVHVGRALCHLPGVPSPGLGLVVVLDEDEIGHVGPVTPVTSSRPAELRQLASAGPWIERGGIEDVACIPLGDADDVAGVLEVPIEAERLDALLPVLDDLSFQLTSVFRHALTTAREQWSDRSPILSIIEHGALSAVFQPVVSLEDGSIVGFEGLSRFECGITPEQRFREATRLGLAVELELLAIRTILEAACSLPPETYVSVNVSPATVLSPHLAALVTGRDRVVKLEVTEHDPVDDYAELVAAVRALEGAVLSVDDAGSGYSSLKHILQLRPDEVKLDREWVAGIDADRPRQVLVGGLRSFVEEVGAGLVAEGIETEAEADTLRALGIRYGQGYLFARPAPAAVFA
jgi:EAL domain-containing protein (putative c-di-GMP-specific phosphodiesterase class I)